MFSKLLKSSLLLKFCRYCSILWCRSIFWMLFKISFILLECFLQVARKIYWYCWVFLMLFEMFFHNAPKIYKCCSKIVFILLEYFSILYDLLDVAQIFCVWVEFFSMLPEFFLTLISFYDVAQKFLDVAWIFFMSVEFIFTLLEFTS